MKIKCGINKKLMTMFIMIGVLFGIADFSIGLNSENDVYAIGEVSPKSTLIAIKLKSGEDVMSDDVNFMPVPKINSSKLPTNITTGDNISATAGNTIKLKSGEDVMSDEINEMPIPNKSGQIKGFDPQPDPPGNTTIGLASNMTIVDNITDTNTNSGQIKGFDPQPDPPGK